MIAQLQAQRQQFKIQPLQVELLNFFFLNSMELQQRIKNEIEENPFLDNVTETAEDDPDTKLSKEDVRDFESSEENIYDDRSDHKSDMQNCFNAGVTIDSGIVSITTFREDAKQQLQLLKISETNKELAEYLIDMLTAGGLMERTPEEAAEEMSFHFQRIVATEEVQRALTIVQSLDPVGMGVVSIKECLLSQLYKMDSSLADVKHAISLIRDNYSELIARRFEKLHRVLNIDNEEMKTALSLVGRLKFHPVTEQGQYDPRQTIIPDFIVTNSKESIEVNLFSSKSDGIFVNRSLYEQLASHVSGRDKPALQYVKEKLSRAQWFVNAVHERENNMLSVMKCIVALQHEYFTTGNISCLKPMVLKNIAEKTGLDISTVSRITGNKYADTPFGIIYLKKLFSEGIADKHGDVISNKVLKSVIGDTIQSENKKSPYTDLQLVNLLSLNGYNIARRTVTKYRRQMQLPSAQIRAVWL